MLLIWLLLQTFNSLYKIVLMNCVPPHNNPMLDVQVTSFLKKQQCSPSASFTLPNTEPPLSQIAVHSRGFAHPTVLCQELCQSCKSKSVYNRELLLSKGGWLWVFVLHSPSKWERHPKLDGITRRRFPITLENNSLGRLACGITAGKTDLAVQNRQLWGCWYFFLITDNRCMGF